MRAWLWLAVALVGPLLVLAALLLMPSMDESWENHAAHFWLVLAAAAIATALGYTVSSAARRRRDARLFLISLAFIASSGFLGLHALATPGVLLGKNAGFELATPFGLAVAGGFAAVSGAELSRKRAQLVLRFSDVLMGALVGLMVLWAAISLAKLPPLDEALPAEELNGWQVALALVGVALYGLAAIGFLRLYRRRQARFAFAITLAFALLAEAMITIAWARNWHYSWWQWHVLMLGSFLVIGLAARAEWHEERWSALYLDETLAGAKEVSVVLADLAGYTAFTEQHDTVEVAAMLNAYFERLIPIMEEADGEVHQIVGDQLMVVFNKQGELPDHELRAATASLALQREAKSIAAEHPDWPRFRVGVNSGEVLAGVVGAQRGHRKHGIVGDVVNVAARLEADAPVDAVLIGEGTYRALGDQAIVVPLPPQRVKGKAAPVAAYVLVSVRPESSGTSP